MTTPTRDELPNKLTYDVKTEILSADTFHIMENINGQFSKTVVSLKEKAIREALVSMGWSPPASPTSELVAALADMVDTYDDGKRSTPGSALHRAKAALAAHGGKE